jgi:hypothetical protein
MAPNGRILALERAPNRAQGGLHATSGRRRCLPRLERCGKFRAFHDRVHKLVRGDCRPEARRSLLFRLSHKEDATASRRPGGACCFVSLAEWMRLPAGGQAEPAVASPSQRGCDCRPEARRSLLSRVLSGLRRLPAGGQAESAVASPSQRGGDCRPEARLSLLSRVPAIRRRLPAGCLAVPPVSRPLLDWCDCRPKARRSLLLRLPRREDATAGRRPGGACCLASLT